MYSTIVVAASCKAPHSPTGMTAITLAMACDRNLEIRGVGEDLAKDLYATRMTFAAGDVLRRQGDEVISIYCVLRGWLTEGCTLYNGTRRLLNFYLPIDIVGIEYVGRATATSELVASEETEVFSFAVADFKKAIMKSETAAVATMSLLSRKYAELQSETHVMAVGSATARIAHTAC